MYAHETNTIKIVNISVTLKTILIPPFKIAPATQEPPICSLSLLLHASVHFLEFYVNGVIQYVLFLRLASFNQHNSSESHLCWHIYQWFIPF